MTKIKNIVFYGCLIFCLTSCYKDYMAPEPEIPIEKFAPIVADIHLAEALLVDEGNLKSKDSLARIYYYQILDFHKISTEQYEKNMQLYLHNPEALEKLYTKVLETLQIGEAKSNARTEQ